MSGPNKKLTNVTNQPDVRDVYANPVWNPRDEFPPFATRDPAGSGGAPLGVGIGAQRAGDLETENPLGGNYRETASQFCDTCGRTISIVEQTLPTHIGHNVRYADLSEDDGTEPGTAGYRETGEGKGVATGDVGKTGGCYRIVPVVEKNEGAWAPRPEQSTDPWIDGTEQPAKDINVMPELYGPGDKHPEKIQPEKG